jgi:hypothetical protein
MRTATKNADHHHHLIFHYLMVVSISFFYLAAPMLVGGHDIIQELTKGKYAKPNVNSQGLQELEP